MVSQQRNCEIQGLHLANNFPYRGLRFHASFAKEHDSLFFFKFSPPTIEVE